MCKVSHLLFHEVDLGPLFIELAQLVQVVHILFNTALDEYEKCVFYFYLKPNELLADPINRKEGDSGRVRNMEGRYLLAVLVFIILMMQV